MNSKPRSTRKKAIEITRGGFTVRIYRRKSHGYDLFQIAYPGVDGRRVMEARSKLDKATARAVAIARLRAAGKVSALDLDQRDVDTIAAAKRAIGDLPVPIHEACREFAAVFRKLEGRASVTQAVDYFLRMHPKDAKPMLVSEAAEALYADKLSLRKSAGYIRQLKHQVGKFATMFRKEIGNVTAADLKLFTDSLAALSPRTRNNCLSGVAELFRFAKRQKYIPKDFDQLDGIGYAAEDPGKVAIFSPDEMAALLAQMDPRGLPSLAIGAFAGLRHSEVMQLDWAEVDLKRGFIEVAKHKAKTRQRRLVPIAPNLAAWLASHVKERGPVVEVSENEDIRLKARAAGAAGFKWRKNALRHSYCSYRMAVTHDAARVSHEAGNSPQMIFANYRELVTPDEAGRWFGLMPQAESNVLRFSAKAG